MIWVLLVLFQIKHFVCDFPLQGKFMLGKFGVYPAYILPLLAHSMVHATATFLIAVWFVSPTMALCLGLTDGAIHFAVDRVKASPTLLGRFKALTKDDFEKHNWDVELLNKIIRVAGSSQVEGHLAEAVESQNDLNDELIDWDERLRSNTYFWWSLGADQAVHHLTHYALIALILYMT